MASTLELVTKWISKTGPEPPMLDVQYQGAQVWRSLDQSSELTSKKILEISKTHGLDVASWVLHQHFKSRPNHQLFFQGSRPHDLYHSSHKELLVMVWFHHPWMGRTRNIRQQFLLKDIASDIGFDVSFPEMGYRRSFYQNAFRYNDHLKRLRGRRLIFLTFGQASLEFRWMIEHVKELPVEPVAWLNINGLIHGTSLKTNSSPLTKPYTYFSNQFVVPPELSREKEHFYQPLEEKIRQIPTVSLLSFPRQSQLRTEQLNPWGPNDGVVTLPDYLTCKHPVEPLIGAGHELDLKMYKSKIQWCLYQLARSL